MASPALVFYRPADASLAIGIVDDAGHLAPGQSSTARLGWTHILAAGHHIVFYALTDGSLTIGHVSTDGRFVHTQATTILPGWTDVEASGDRLLFYRCSTAMMTARSPLPTSMARPAS
jgi:hypothetical protein